jgi:hypothetical protein
VNSVTAKKKFFIRLRHLSIVGRYVSFIFAQQHVDFPAGHITTARGHGAACCTFIASNDNESHLQAVTRSHCPR